MSNQLDLSGMVVCGWRDGGQSWAPGFDAWGEDEQLLYEWARQMRVNADAAARMLADKAEETNFGAERLAGINTAPAILTIAREAAALVGPAFPSRAVFPRWAT